MDEHNQQKAATPPHKSQLHFVDGHWHRAPDQHQARYDHCLSADGKSAVAGEDTEQITWSVAQQPDGTMRGVYTDTVLTNECGIAGGVRQSPIVLTRVGDVPPTVTVADPATVTSSTPSSGTSAPVPGPVLNGTYRFDFDYLNQTENGQSITNKTGAPRASASWWAFRSLCTSAGCVATGAQLTNENHALPTGSAASVLRFVDGHWQDTPHLGDRNKCFKTPNGNATDERTVSWSFEPQPDGTLRGVQTATTITNECGEQGDVWRTPIVATRVGDFPPAATVADPALFLAPTTPPTNGPR